METEKQKKKTQLFIQSTNTNFNLSVTASYLSFGRHKEGFGGRENP